VFGGGVSRMQALGKPMERDEDNIKIDYTLKEWDMRA
jgi:hypothetical protein